MVAVEFCCHEKETLFRFVLCFVVCVGGGCCLVVCGGLIWCLPCIESGCGLCCRVARGFVECYV